jgi:hypothetical protein
VSIEEECEPRGIIIERGRHGLRVSARLSHVLEYCREA